MPFEKVTHKDGRTKTIVAGSDAELKEAVQAFKDEKTPTTVDINVPVRKGHDLLNVEEDGVTQGLSDGTGAHNSPRDAVRDDGSIEGDPNVPVVVVPSENTAVPAGAKKLVKDGKLEDLTEEDLATADTEAGAKAAADVKEKNSTKK